MLPDPKAPQSSWKLNPADASPVPPQESCLSSPASCGSHSAALSGGTGGFQGVFSPWFSCSRVCQARKRTALTRGGSEAREREARGSAHALLTQPAWRSPLPFSPQLFRIRGSPTSRCLPLPPEQAALSSRPAARPAARFLARRGGGCTQRQAGCLPASAARRALQAPAARSTRRCRAGFRTSSVRRGTGGQSRSPWTDVALQIINNLQGQRGEIIKLYSPGM